MITTIVLPVSRPDFLHRIFAQLDMMHCNAQEVNLLCYVDGDLTLYEKAHNFVRLSRFKEKLCVYRRKGLPNISHIKARRERIAAIHNEIKQIVNFCDYVFLLEDDTLFPLNTLEKLLRGYSLYPHAGFITGVQVGRWGMNVLGVWQVDNPYDVKKISSKLPPNGESDKERPIIEQIDAAGLYCCITKLQNYKSTHFTPFDTILGPDVFFGLYLRQQGYKNYVDWSIQTEHLTKKEVIKVSNTELQKVTFDKIETGKWSQILE